METIILQFDQNPNIAKDSLVPIMTTDRRLIPLNGSKLGHSFSSTSIFKCCSIDVPLIKVKINHSFCTVLHVLTLSVHRYSVQFLRVFSKWSSTACIITNSTCGCIRKLFNSCPKVSAFTSPEFRNFDT